MWVDPEYQAKRRLHGELVLRTVTAQAGRTTMRLEAEFWNAADDVCRREGISMDELIKRAQERLLRASRTSRTSAVRVYLMSYFRDRVPGVG